MGRVRREENLIIIEFEDNEDAENAIKGIELVMDIYERILKKVLHNG